MLGKAELKMKLSTSAKVTIYHGGKERASKVRNYEANVRESEAAKKQRGLGWGKRK